MRREWRQGKRGNSLITFSCPSRIRTKLIEDINNETGADEEPDSWAYSCPTAVPPVKQILTERLIELNEMVYELHSAVSRIMFKNYSVN